MRKRFKHWLYGSSAILALVLLFAHTPPAKTSVRHLLSRWLASGIGGSAEIGELDYRLWRGEVDMADLRWETPSFRLTVQQIKVLWRPMRGIEIQILNPQLVVQQTDGTPPEPVAVPMVTPSLAAIEIHDGELEIRRANDEPWLWVTSVDVRISSTHGAQVGSLTAPNGRVVVPGGKQLSFGPLQIDFGIEPQKLAIANAAVEKADSFLRAQGEITSISPLAMDLDLDYGLDQELANELAANLKLSGTLEGQAHLIADADGLHGETVFQSASLTSPLTGTWSVDGEMTLRGSQVTVPGLRFQGYGGTVDAHGLFDFEHQHHTLEADLSRFDVGALSQDLFERSIPITSVLDGHARLTLEGPGLEAARGNAQLTLTPKPGNDSIPLSGRIELTADPEELVLRSNDLSMPFVHGSVRGRVRRDGSVNADYEAQVEDLRSLDPWFKHLHLPEITNEISGMLSLEGHTTGSWHQPSNMSSSLSLDFPSLALKGTKGKGRLEVRKQGRQLSFDKIEAEWGKATTSAAGTYHLDTHEMTAKLEAHRFRLSELALPALLEEWDAVATSIRAEVSGRFPTLAGQIDISLNDVEIGETELPSLIITARSDGRTAKLECRLEDSQVLASGAVSLEHPYSVESSVDLSVLPLDQLLRGLIPSTPEETRLGARGRLDISLPLARMEELVYRAQVEQIVGTYGGVEGATDSAFVIVGDRDSLTIDELALVGRDTAIAIKGRIPLSTASTFDLQLYGDAKLTLVNQLLEAVELEGHASLDLHLSGSRDEPNPIGELRIDNGAVTWNGICGSGLTAIVTAREGRAYLQEASGSLLGGTFQMSGESPLPYPSVERSALFNLEVEDVDLAELSVSLDDSAIQPLALVSANGTLEARGLELSQIRGSGNIVMLLTSIGDIIIENETPFPWSFENNRLTLHELHAVGGDTALDIDLTAELKDEAWAWRSSLRGTFDNVFLNPLIRTWDAALSGTTRIDLLIEGIDEVPTFVGAGQIENAGFALREPPLVLNHLSGEVQFSGKTLRLVDITADAGGGTAQSSGQVEIGSFSELASLDLELAGDSIRLNYPDGMRSRLSGTLRLRGKPGLFLLSGDIRMDDALFDRTITLESELLSSVERQNLSYSDEVSFAETVMLDIRAQSTNDIRIDNNLAQAQANANLRMSGTLEAPELDGVIIARAEGTFQLGRNLYRIESGSVAFRGYPSAPAELDVSARTKVSGIEIIVRLNGPVDDINMELRAPDHSMLSQGDIASLLVTGRTLANVSDLQSVTGQERQIVGEQLASYLSGTLTNLVQRGLGDTLPFDTVSVAPSTLETDISPEIRFSIGKALTEDLFITYSIGLDNVQSQLWMVDYRLPKKLALRATRKEDNEFAGRLSQQLEFDFPGRPDRSDETIKRAKVAKVDIFGGPVELEGQLSKKVRLRPGKSFDYWTSQKDVERLTRFLKEEGHLNATVESRWTPTNDKVGSLTYRIETGSPIHIRWTGDDPGDAIRSDVLNRWDGRFPLNFLLPDLTAKITEALMQGRFFEAEVKATVEEGADGIQEVVFDVRKGSKGQSITLDFEGNQALPDDDLQKALPPTSSRDFFELLQNPRRLQERIRLHYLSQGYVQARIGSPQVDFSKATGDYRVTVPVDEGPIAIVQEIAFHGVDYFEHAKLLDELRLGPGYPFRLKDYSEDRSTLTRIYRREGFTTTRVRGRLDATESAFRVVYEVEEGPQEKIGEIRFVGNHATNEGIIRRQLTFQENDPLRLSDFTETQQKLYELGVFRSVDMRTESKDGISPTSDVVVHLDETRDVHFGYGLRYSTQDRLEVLTGIRIPSLFGSAHHAGLTFTLNANESILRGSYSMPYFWRYKLGTDFFLSRETDENDSFAEKTWSFTFQQHRKLSEKTGLQWGYTYRHNYILGKVTENSPFPTDFTISAVDSYHLSHRGWARQLHPALEWSILRTLLFRWLQKL